jgi:NADPH:quinone reductase-like Zn-dependent oxidoreductase
MEQGAQVGVAMYTASLCLYHALKIDLAKDSFDLLVWGGSSSVGQAVVQLGHLAGLRIIATASPRNFDLVKSLGADYVLSYAEADTPSKIRELTGGKLKYAVDCIAEKDTPQQISQSISDEGGEVAIILNYKSPRPNIKIIPVLAYFLIGKVSAFLYDPNSSLPTPPRI